MHFHAAVICGMQGMSIVADLYSSHPDPLVMPRLGHKLDLACGTLMGMPNGRLELEGVLGMGAVLWLQC